MAGMETYEDARVVSRAGLAAWLRQLASQLESGGQIFYGAGGAVTVADQVHCELEIERESGSQISVEIEFSWADPEAADSAATTAEVGAGGDEDTAANGAAEQPVGAGEPVTAVEVGSAGDIADVTAATGESTKDTAERAAGPTQEV